MIQLEDGGCGLNGFFSTYLKNHFHGFTWLYSIYPHLNRLYYYNNLKNILKNFQLRNTPYYNNGMSYISFILRFMFSISSRNSLFSFSFSSTFVTEYMMVV